MSRSIPSSRAQQAVAETENVAPESFDAQGPDDNPLACHIAAGLNKFRVSVQKDLPETAFGVASSQSDIGEAEPTASPMASHLSPA
jgi:hypothetical protein